MQPPAGTLLSDTLRVGTCIAGGRLGHGSPGGTLDLDLLTASPFAAVATFIACAAIIGVAGTAITIRAEQLARVTGLGQALLGIVFIGAMTSLSGLATSITAAATGHAGLAVGNALGGIAAQTAFLAVADMAWRRANLEHAAASEVNLLQATLLMLMLALPLVAASTPQLAAFGVHPVSLILVGVYVAGVRLVASARERPMWTPRLTVATESEDEAAPRPTDAGAVRLWAGFAGLAVVVATAGFFIARSGLAISDQFGFDETLVGSVFTALSTSLPELVIAVVAVRRGLLTLAVADILGGNMFDVLFLSVGDVVWRGGSIYEAVGPGEVFWIAVALVMAGVLLLGLLRRERHGPGNIGFESLGLLLIYGSAIAIQAFA